MKFHALCLSFAFLLSAPAAEPPGQWKAADKEGRPWKHPGTGLNFPSVLSNYRLAGEFAYEAGGSFIRYENLDERARADIFFFPTGPNISTLEEKQRLILQEMDNVSKDLEAMVKQGRYKNLAFGPLGAGSLELWRREPLPMAARSITATRIGKNDEGVVEAMLHQWVGITIYEKHLITIRQMRPASTGPEGDAALQSFAQSVFQVIKDPAMKIEISQMIDKYMAAPFSEESIQASGAVLAYLKQSPFYPINIPEYPVSEWLEHCNKISAGTDQTLLTAFMLGSAKAAFAEGDAFACLKAGSKQFAVIYRQLATKHPGIAKPEMEEFVAEAEKDRGDEWLMRFTGMKK
ncbi:MAG: hypothetical protein RL015_1321 [Verrucomicrobiota bacterium]|jgi:hypothetical protein